VVVTRVYGGLGNQMFQYAAGLGLAERLSTRLLVDARWFRDVGPLVGRPFQLSAFGVAPSPGTVDRMRILVRRPRLFREDRPGYQPEIEGLHGDVVLDGYWQSERYFAHCEARVRAAFSFPPSTAPLLAQIRSSESVSLHVRRGDYVDEKRERRLGLMPLEYYDAAIALLRDELGDPRFFVFSDDLEWCRGELGGRPDVAFADRAAPDHEHMQLMASCRHNVVANSSFSWWGAWLNPNPEKIVVAPKQWFRDSSLEPTDLVPPAWLRL
jgi:hypothetical protein